MDINTQRCPNCAGQLGMEGNKKICPFGAEFEIDTYEADEVKETKTSYIIQEEKKIEITPEDKEKRIKDICAEFIKCHGSEEFKITEKLIKEFKIPFGEKIYLAHDDTLRHTGKNGFVITENGIYGREIFDPTATFTSFSKMYNDVSNIVWYDKAHSVIKYKGKVLTYYSRPGKAKEEIMNLIVAIVALKSV